MPYKSFSINMAEILALARPLQKIKVEKVEFFAISTNY